jgi:chromosome segregation ATPase
MSTDFLDAHQPLSAIEKAQRQQAKQDRAEIREEERQRAERAERREALLLANSLNGDPLGQLSAVQRRCADLADEVNDLESQLDKKRRALASARGSLQHWADEHLIVEELAARSAPFTDPAYNALVRAREAHQRYVEHARERSAEVDDYRRKYLAKVGQQ